MSLTKDDKDWIVGAVGDAISELVLPRFDEVGARLDEHDRKFVEIHNELTGIHSEISGIKEDIAELSGKLDAITNDIKEIYDMLAKLQKAERQNSKDIKKLRTDFEEELRRVNSDVQRLAQATGIVL